MAGVALPAIPGSGRELEDYVACLFQAARYFVERGIHERSFTDVLELDVVATSYEHPTPRSVLIESKGGNWGFPDVFKVVGWMRYLGISESGFFVKDGAPKDVGSVHRKVAPLGVSLVDLADFADPAARFREAGFGEIRDPLLTEIWRYSFWVERVLIDQLRRERRARPGQRGPTAVLAYHDLIHDHVFFIKDVSERLHLLYRAYRDHPKLSLALAAELGGGPFDASAASARNPILTEAVYRGSHPALQASLYVEHRGRLSILKAAIDLLCCAEAPCDGAGGDPRARFDALPPTFREGLRSLRAKPSFRRYALLWQVFLWGFGGFYLANRAEEEFGWLSEQSGIPIGEIAAGLRAFDDLFPLAEGSWLSPLRGTNIVVAKLVPMAFRGIGALQRLRRYGFRTYDELGYRDVTARTLGRWHNSIITLLS